MHHSLRQLFVAMLVLALGGCFGGAGGPQKAPLSALWIGPSSPPLEVSDVSRLKEVGVGELFLTAAELDPAAADGPLKPVAAPALPASVPVTLAVTGRWDGGGDPAALAEQVAEAARRLRFDFEGRGGLPIGWHFDLNPVSSFASYATFLEELRGKLDRSLFLSATIDRRWLGDPGVKAVAGAVDFVVPFLYGQRVSEDEDGEAWSFDDLERKLQIVEEMEVPYLLGIVTLGTATHLGNRGDVKGRLTTFSLQEILRNRALKLGPGFSLSGVNRRVYEVQAEQPTALGKWEVKLGEKVRIVRASTSDVEELRRLVGAWENPHYLGLLFYRLPGPEERMSLSLENLLNALEPTPASPDLELEANLQRRTGRGYLMRFSITNRNGEITELSLVDSNYLQVRCLNGTFSEQRVEPGDFYRFVLFHTGPDGTLKKDYRDADVLRLHLPILEGEQKVTSRDVEVLVRGEPRLELEGHFLLPDGRELTVGPMPWPNQGGGAADAGAR